MRIRKYKNYSIERFRKFKKCPYEKYEPVNKMRFEKEKTVPWIYRIGGWIAGAGGFIEFFIYGIFKGIKEFFNIRKHVKKRFEKGKIIEIKRR